MHCVNALIVKIPILQRSERTESFQRNFGHQRAALMSSSMALSQTPAKAAGPWTCGQCVAWRACLLPILHCSTLFGDNRGNCVNTLSKVALDSAAADSERTSDLQSQVQHLNHCATLILHAGKVQSESQWEKPINFRGSVHSQSYDQCWGWNNNTAIKYAQ